MPDPETIQNLCWVLNVEPNYFFSVGDSYYIPNISPMPEMRKIPLIGTISCGAPILATQNIEEYVSIPKNISADFVLTCKGDSMINARIFDGDVVYIRQQPTVDSGEIAAVLIDNEATLKRVQIFDDHIVLQPENPMYKPISNIGSFGENVYKVGMTRRLDPLDRVRELGDASVPFSFDVHAFIETEDAPALETELHKALALTQMNKVNPRKEFFRVDLSIIKSMIEKRGLKANWTMVADAAEYKESLAIEERIKNNEVERKRWEEYVASLTAEPDLADEAV